MQAIASLRVKFDMLSPEPGSVSLPEFYDDQAKDLTPDRICARLFPKGNQVIAITT
jgi:hypothetical protein